MYNLIVTAEEGAWDNDNYRISRSRFLEYTNEEIASKFRELNTENLDRLKEIPCIFAYEGTDSNIFIGFITQISAGNKYGDIKFSFHIDRGIRPINFSEILRYKNQLDIRDWEVNRTHWAIKDEDLIEVLSQIINTDKIEDKNNKVKAEDIPEPQDLNKKIENVSDIINHVLSLGTSKEVFYRGHTKRSKYLLEPSLFRKDEKGNLRYFKNGDVMYRELLVSNSLDFRDDVYTLDRLVRAQHYSLPTRLLDITSNPLIGLFFAASSNFDEDGEVILMEVDGNKIKYFDSDTASAIANLTRLSNSDKEKIDLSLDKDTFNENKVVQRLLHFIKEEKPYFEGRIEPEDLRSVICVKGKQSNNRISFQSGAFLLFGHEAVMPEDGNENISITRITVKNKVQILNQLNKLNINERTVYPSIDNSAKHIAKTYQFKEEK